MFRIRSLAQHALVATAICTAFPHIASSQTRDDLTALSLENLMNVQVSSVTRHQEELRKTPAAVYVITQEEIRRSGVTDIAELLRLVPGLQVSQINSNVWAVGARGFNTEYSNKLLVLVDGRTVYDPTFSGVYWRLQELVLEDIDRIEIIRGPGATMWGANAVNGVISITTKRAEDTQGGLLVADSGTGRPAEGSLRFGGSFGKNASYRVFGTQTTRSGLRSPSGANGLDSWNLTDSGFRLDWNPSKSDSLTIDGGSYRGVAGGNQKRLLSFSPIRYASGSLLGNVGGHLLTRWNHSFKGSSNLTIQTYYDRARLTGYKGKDVATFDLDLQYSIKLGQRNDVMVGFGRREYRDHFDNELSFGLIPSHRSTNLTSGFAQDEITLIKDKLYFTVGSKVEKSSFTGSNLQPAAHLSWLLTSRQSAWLSVSRAVRTPSRIEREMYVNTNAFVAGPLTGLVNIYGQSSNRSEGLNAYEAGYRYQANRKWWLDIASFYNVYDHLIAVENGGGTFFQAQPGPPHLVLPLYWKNGTRGETYGAEAAANYRLNSSFTLKGSYSLLRLALHGYQGTSSGESAEGQSPRHQVYIGSFLNLPRSFEVSGHAYIVGSLPGYQVPAHTRLDLNIGWKGLEDVELSLVGQNLLGAQREFGDLVSPANVVKPSIYGKITWRF